MRKNCEVVVVGAGPAGSMAASTLAERGVDVLVLEQKLEIGPPKRCAEGVATKHLLSVGFKAGSWAVHRITGARLYSPGLIEVRLKGHEGYVLERKAFEKSLASEAIRKGAKYMLGAKAEGVLKEDGWVKGVFGKRLGESFKVEAKVVIAADGIESRVGRSAGLVSSLRPEDVESCFQYELVGLDLEDPKELYLYFGKEVAPGGYLWIFPKAADAANVGVGVNPTLASFEAKKYLDNFLERNREVFEKASPVEINAGCVCVRPLLRGLVDNGILLVGDAARMTNPLHGGGIGLALKYGKLAGEVVAEALEANDLSRKGLDKYEAIWRQTDGKLMERLVRLKRVFEKLSDDDLDFLAKELSGKDISKLLGGEVRLLLSILTKRPALLKLAKELL